MTLHSVDEKPAMLSPTVVSPRAPRVTQRFAVFASLAIAEVFLASFLFRFQAGLPQWSNPLSYTSKIAHFAIFGFVAFVIVAWPRRRQMLAAWSAAARKHNWKLCILGNLSLFAGLLFARSMLSNTAELHWPSLAAFWCLIMTTGGSIALVAAPAAFWRELPRIAPTETALALAGGCFVTGASRLSQEGWSALSTVTLSFSHWILALYEPNVHLDSERQLLEIDGFSVQIWPSCSGYEGVGLIVAFLTIYLWAFRRGLRFPNALFLFPIGVAAIWVLNSLRIAALMSIGAHVSPMVALDGFHSQGGWIAFLLATIGTIAISRQFAFFCAPAPDCNSTTERRDNRDENIVLAFLAPFMALLLANILASAFAPQDQWLYPLKVVGVGATLWWFRRVYLRLTVSVSAASVVVGSLVGVIWIVTDLPKGSVTPLGLWLDAVPASIAIVWLALRALGSIVLVPLAEELAFRGYLHRVLIAHQFEKVAPGRFGWVAFIVSSISFGVLHQRWGAACLAGGTYAALMYRTNRLSDPIAAHMASNAVVTLWALATAQWSLL